MRSVPVIKYQTSRLLLNGVLLLICILCFASNSLSAIEKPNKLTIGITSQSKPFLIDMNEGKGIDPEMLLAIFNHAGYQVSFVATPPRRKSLFARKDSIDAVVSWRTNFDIDCFYSAPYRVWHNALIVKAGSNIKTASDLQGRRVTIFSGAESLIPDYQHIKSIADTFIEFESSHQAARLVTSGRAEAYIGDYAGLFYFLIHEMSQTDVLDRWYPVAWYETNKQYVCFKNEQIRDEFNQSLKQVAADGTLARIYHQYAPIVPGMPGGDPGSY